MTAAGPKLLQCSKRGTPGKSGRVVLTLAVAGAGHVDKATVKQSYDPMVSECMIGVAKTLRFPKASGPTEVTFPVNAKNPPVAGAACDAEALKEKGMTMINMGQHAGALAQFEASLKCKDDPYVRQLAFMEACASSNSAKAKLYYKTMTPGQRAKFAQICIRQKPGVPYDDSLPNGGLPSDDADADEDGEGYLQLNSKPAAKVFIDGVDTGLTTPVSGKQLKLPAGRHKVTFLIGTDRFTYPVLIVDGQTETMTKDLQ
jgi:hypothetical protein